MLLAQVARAGGVPWMLGIAKDEAQHLRARIAEGLQADILILSGGVSAGKFDLVPGVLTDLGVQALFHKVAMKPGKPVLFGVKRGPHPQPLSQGPRGECLVFGLPGNPVASFVCFELFVRPAIRAHDGQLPTAANSLKATLASDYPYRTDRPDAGISPACLQSTDAWAGPSNRWRGSVPPICGGVVSANARSMVLPEGDHLHRAGQVMDVPWASMISPGLDVFGQHGGDTWRQERLAWNRPRRWAAPTGVRPRGGQSGTACRLALPSRPHRWAAALLLWMCFHPLRFRAGPWLAFAGAVFGAGSCESSAAAGFTLVPAWAASRASCPGAELDAGRRQSHVRRVAFARAVLFTLLRRCHLGLAPA